MAAEGPASQQLPVLPPISILMLHAPLIVKLNEKWNQVMDECEKKGVGKILLY